MRFESRLLTDDELKPRGPVIPSRSRSLALVRPPQRPTAGPDRRGGDQRGGRDADRGVDGDRRPHGPGVRFRHERSRTGGGHSDRTVKAGSGQPFRGGLSYAKISRLKAARGVLAGRVPRGLQRAGGMVPGCIPSSARNSHRSPRTRFESCAASCSRSGRNSSHPERIPGDRRVAAQVPAQSHGGASSGATP